MNKYEVIIDNKVISTYTFDNITFDINEVNHEISRTNDDDKAIPTGAFNINNRRINDYSAKGKCKCQIRPFYGRDSDKHCKEGYYQKPRVGWIYN
jgi:hypothetical protein